MKFFSSQKAKATAPNPPGRYYSQAELRSIAINNGIERLSVAFLVSKRRAEDIGHVLKTLDDTLPFVAGTEVKAHPAPGAGYILYIQLRMPKGGNGTLGQIARYVAEILEHILKTDDIVPGVHVTR